MAQLPEVERTSEIPCPIDQLWADLIEGALTGEWLGIIIEPRVGGDVTDVGRTMIGAVEEIVDGQRLTWTWRHPDGEPSQVTVTLEPGGDESTTIHVVERMLPYEISHFPPIVSSSLAA